MLKFQAKQELAETTLDPSLLQTARGDFSKMGFSTTDVSTWLSLYRGDETSSICDVIARRSSLSENARVRDFWSSTQGPKIILSGINGAWNKWLSIAPCHPQEFHFVILSIIVLTKTDTFKLSPTWATHRNCGRSAAALCSADSKLVKIGTFAFRISAGLHGSCTRSENVYFSQQNAFWSKTIQDSCAGSFCRERSILTIRLHLDNRSIATWEGGFWFRRRAGSVWSGFCSRFLWFVWWFASLCRPVFCIPGPKEWSFVSSLLLFRGQNSKEN